MRFLCFIVIALIFIGCKEKVSKPSFILFKIENDTLKVLAENTLACPMFVKIENRQSQDFNTVQLKVNETKPIQYFNASETDSLKILNTYKFAGYYGIHDFRRYDTLFNYALPFKSGYKSSIIQGYDGSFSHKGKFSAKTLDFNMKIGDTVVASRSGVVIKVIDTHNKQGTTDEFRKYGNYIMVYHKDNTFSQYVHIKQKGSLVKVGDSIKQNQPIALSGFTGMTTVPHLHFGVYKPTVAGFESIEIMIDSIPAHTLKKGQVLIKK